MSLLGAESRIADVGVPAIVRGCTSGDRIVDAAVRIRLHPSTRVLSASASASARASSSASSSASASSVSARPASSSRLSSAASSASSSVSASASASRVSSSASVLHASNSAASSAAGSSSTVQSLSASAPALPLRYPAHLHLPLQFIRAARFHPLLHLPRFPVQVAPRHGPLPSMQAPLFLNPARHLAALAAAPHLPLPQARHCGRFILCGSFCRLLCPFQPRSQ
ncbi:hypothetical protein FB45DRAFT_441409 [Roridomyces roridus]|uniref:Uncharacterized protein n=1 Tax=Roridomyces roridus TaxID=1738132 RepID=A0AAD7F767_9AGAR|nr:hypothetical protein FB45DRAFT_441409 [Roridomyces roridus]